MTTSKVWEVMNDLESVTSKICSAREILDCAVDRLQEHQYDKVETLMYAVDEYLQYYLAEFDEKFKLAWKETVVKQKEKEKTLNYQEAVDAGWEMTADGFWIPPQKEDKVKKWVLPVEQVHDDYFISFPDDLLEAADLKEGDQVEWFDNGDGSYTLKKVIQFLGMDEC